MSVKVKNYQFFSAQMIELEKTNFSLASRESKTVNGI